jgi:hypothetical protein
MSLGRSWGWLVISYTEPFDHYPTVADDDHGGREDQDDPSAREEADAEYSMPKLVSQKLSKRLMPALNYFSWTGSYPFSFIRMNQIKPSELIYFK